jgi:hypothetical protein
LILTGFWRIQSPPMKLDLIIAGKTVGTIFADYESRNMTGNTCCRGQGLAL